jgi:adenosine 3'-phospho 5'-phosphosulfate transporter B2
VNGKSYPWLEYAEASAITFGVAMFTFSESASNTLNSHHKAKAQGELDASLFSYGILLIGFYLLCDSFTSQWQSRVFKKFGIDQYQMMLGVNVWSTAFTLIALLQAGEFFSTFGLLFQDSNAMWNMIVLSITSATGQLFIFYTIKEFGPVIFTIFMTTRQIISLFLSCIMFGHPLTGFSFFSAFFVFLVVFYRIYRKGSD